MNKHKPLDIKQLQAFEKLCCTNSFTQTAKHLHVTQSAISHSIRGLEEDIGSKLVLKKGRKIILTQAGEKLLEFARPMLEGMMKVKEEISEGKIDQVERLRIGGSPASINAHCNHDAVIGSVSSTYKTSEPVNDPS